MTAHQVPPAPAGRESAARRRILDTAAQLFYAHGIRGVGVDTIIAESRVAKATLYAHFPTKDDLILAYLAAADEAWRGKLRAAAEAAGPHARDQLAGLFDALRQACARDGFRGCAFLNTAAEAPPGTPVHDATVAHKAAVRDWVATLARSAGATDPHGLARALTILLDGALADSALEPDADIPAQAARAARALIDAGCPRKGSRTDAAPG